MSGSVISILAKTLRRKKSSKKNKNKNKENEWRDHTLRKGVGVGL